MKGLDVFVLVILFLTLGLGVYILIESLPGKTVEFESTNKFNGNSSAVSSATQFYPNMRYPNSIITYSISDSCDYKKSQSISDAFRILQSKTILTFEKTQNGGQIDVLCSEVSPTSTDKNHFVAGEGGPVDVYISGEYYVITSGKVSLFRDDKCDKPQIATHEILHALGFDHNSNLKSIMYPVTSCDEIIDQYIIDEIDRIYAVKSAADLKITSASASKSGKYLSFTTQIENIGLVDAKEVTLHVYAADKEIKNISLGSIPMGSKKKISGEYILVPKEVTSIKMVATIGVGENEISLENNELELNIKQV